MKKIILILLVILLILPIAILAKNYRGSEYRTIQSYLYGRFEVRYQASAGSGQTSTFFLYNDDYPNTPWNEIDIEILGRYTDDIQFNPITPGRINHVSHQFLNFNPTSDFHTYAIEWTPDYVAWFVEGVEVHRQTGDHIAALNISQKIMMNIWPPTSPNWVGEWNSKRLPFFAYYDYVSYASYTPDSGDMGTDNNFTFQWKDDFDSWDQLRWQKATHTFQGNNCDFTLENVVFIGGNMILCLTDDINLGYQDKIAPSVLWARLNENRITVKFSEELDGTSAEKKSNYMISGVTIEEINCLEDSRTVELAVSGIDTSKANNLVVLGVQDRASPPNKLIGQSIKIFTLPLNKFPLKINIGGVTDNGFLQDQEWSENANYGYQDGTKSFVSDAREIDGTEDDNIYKSNRYGLVKYNARVPNGLYKLTLLMAETHINEPLKRIFDVYVEGALTAKNLDIFSEVGKNTAYNILVDNLEVTDNVIDIHFCAVIDEPIINGLIIEPLNLSIVENDSNSPDEFFLSQNFPNPFNSSTAIRYGLPEKSTVKIIAYDILGREVDQLINKEQQAGVYQVNWHGGSRSGVYFYKITTASNIGTFSAVKKMVYLK